MSEIQLYNCDCLNTLPSIPSGTVDAVITDLPYGVTNKSSEAGKWDCPLPMDELWEQFWRILKPNGICVLFSQGMFTASLMMSQPSFWRYNLIWDKCRATGFLNSNKMPLRRHEDICVFYRTLPTYNVQLEDLNGREATHKRGSGVHKATNRCYGSYKASGNSKSEGKKFPGSILHFPKPHCSGNHPTEKSVDLCRWLIRTYTNPGDTVLDATMGSGTTLVAAVLEGRCGIGIEKDERYFNIAKGRIETAQRQPIQEVLPLN